MALRYHLATYDPATYLVGDEIVSGTPTFVHTSTIYAYDKDGAPQSFGENKRVIKGGRYVSDTEVYADNGSGTLLDPLPMTVWQPAATNYLTESEDMSQDKSYNSITISGLTDIVPNNGASQGILYDGITLTRDVKYTISVEVKAGTSDWIRLGFIFADGGWGNIAQKGVYFDLANGTKESTFTDDANGYVTFFDSAIEPLDNGYYLCSVTYTLDSTAYTDQHREIEMRMASADGSVSISGDGVSVFTQCRQMQITQTDRVVGPIYTTTSTEATDETINTYPSANWSNSEGPIYLIHDYKGIDEVILLNDDVPILYVTSDVLYLDDGTNQTSIAYATEGEQEIGVALDETNGFMRLNVNGTWAD